jgi:D-3-phosphoglycerate dehydrogenase
MKKVLIPTKLDRIAADILVANGHYEVVQDDSKPLEDLAKAHTDAYALIVRSEKVTKKVIDLMPGLKVVVRAGAGYDNIDTKHARKQGVDVMNTPGANSNAVAEEVVALMLADARHVVAADVSTRTGKWEKNKFMGREITGKTVGIVGLGSIGQLVIRRLQGFDVRVLGYDPAISAERAQALNVQLTNLDVLFKESDYISLHIPETEETRKLVGPRLLALVKPGVTIVNCARAGVVDEEELRRVKTGKKLRYLNDVYPEDKEGPKTITDVADIMMPHLGANTHEANYKAAQRAAEELIELDEKGVTSFIVNRDIPDGLDRAYCQLAYVLARLCRHMVGRSTTPRLLETTFYGSLQPFADWLLISIVAGLCEDCDSAMSVREARERLEAMGVEYVNRPGDPEKGFESSITVDLTSEVDSETLRRMSIRGTVAEGVLMVSRINEFHKLFFEPTGHTVFLMYDDRPGVIGTIGQKLAGAGVNIEDMRNPHDPKTNRSLAILHINREPAPEIMRDISMEIRAISAFCIKL